MSKDEYFNVETRQGHIINIGMRDIDFGFVPAGVEIPLVEEFQAQLKKQHTYKSPDNFDSMKPEEKQQSMRRSAALYGIECRSEARTDNIRFVAIFTSFFFPEIDEEYLSKHESGSKVDEAMTALTEAITRDYYGVVAELNEKRGQEKKAVASARKKKK